MLRWWKLLFSKHFVVDSNTTTFRENRTSRAHTRARTHTHTPARAHSSLSIGRCVSRSGAKRQTQTFYAPCGRFTFNLLSPPSASPSPLLRIPVCTTMDLNVPGCHALIPD